MKIKQIEEEVYENFAKDHFLASMYQSLEWFHLKQDEGRKCELLGLYQDDTLLGVSLVIYLPILKKKKMAYLSRGFLYNYDHIPEFKKALRDYFHDVIFIRMDPPLILATYDKALNKEENVDNFKLINILKENGFIHFGFNMANEAMQFRFVHRLELTDSWDKQLLTFSKSTRKNISLADFKGVKASSVDSDSLEEVVSFFDKTLERKHVKGFSLKFYQNILKEFKDQVTMYLIYIDKKTYLNNLDKKIKESQDELVNVKNKMEHDHVGEKLKKAYDIAEANIHKYEDEKTKALELNDITNIASMLTITKYKEVVSLSSGMDNNYREFCPKYVMYPEMIKKAIDDKLSFVNFLGVKNIFDEKDLDHGVYEVKRGFGGKTIEYIGQFDLPVKPLLYKVYKTINKLK